MRKREQRSHPSSPCRWARTASPASKGLEVSLHQFSAGYDAGHRFPKFGSLELVQNEQQATDRLFLPVQRNDLPAAGGPVSPILQLHRGNRPAVR